MKQEDLLKSTICNCGQTYTHVKWHSLDCKYRKDWFSNYQTLYMNPSNLYLASVLLNLKPEIKTEEPEHFLDRQFRKYTEQRYNYDCDLYVDEGNDKPVLVEGTSNTVRAELSQKLAKSQKNYVYVVFVDKSLKYIGKGRGDRYKHAVSGISSVMELNRDLFLGKLIEVKIVQNGLTESVATLLERDMIGSAKDKYDLYNKKLPKDFIDILVDEVVLYNQ